MGGSIAHVIGGFLASLCSAFLHLALSDGRSVVVTRASSEALIASTPLGAKYGVGVFHDSKGYKWEEEEHGVYGCDEKRRLGYVAVSFAFVALVANALLVLLHLFGAQRGGRRLGLAALAGHAVSFVSLAIVIGAASALYDREYCGSAVKEHFELTYGIPFVALGMIVAVLNSVLLFATGSLKEDDEAATGENAGPPDSAGKSEPVFE